MSACRKDARCVVADVLGQQLHAEHSGLSLGGRKLGLLRDWPDEAKTSPFIEPSASTPSQRPPKRSLTPEVAPPLQGRPALWLNVAAL